MLRKGWSFIRLGLALYLFILLFFMIFEELFVYPAPRYPRGNWQPPHLQFEDVFFSSRDGTRLHGWYFPNSDARGHLLYCHGNGDFVAALGDFADRLRQSYNLSVFVFDYRGYGRSEGKPREEGVLADGRAARAWLAERAGIAPADVLVMGRSLGGAVAVDLSYQVGAKALILESTFSSLPEVASTLYPWLPVGKMMRNRFDSQVKIVNYRGPLLQSHGTDDNIVPFELGRKLYSAAIGEKRFVSIDGGGHNGPLPEWYFEEIGDFLNQVLKPS